MYIVVVSILLLCAAVNCVLSMLCLTGIKPQKVQLKLTVKYKKLQPCLSLTDVIEREIKVWFGTLNKIWGPPGQTTSNGFCSSNDCTGDEINVKVTCATSGKRRRRAAEEGVADVTVDGLP